MLEKYAATFAALPPAASEFLWKSLLSAYPARMPAPNGAGTGGAALHDACHAVGLFQAEVVMAVAGSPHPLAVEALEVFVGHKLRPQAAPRPPAGPHCNYPNCKCPRSDDTGAQTCPLGLPVAAPPSAAPAAPRKARPAPQRRDPRPVLSVIPNPRKEGTAAHAGYACWVVGDTVDQCIARGLPVRYVRKDVRRGRVRLGPVPR